MPQRHTLKVPTSESSASRIETDAAWISPRLRPLRLRDEPVPRPSKLRHCPAPVRRQVLRFVSELSQILRGSLVGVYLHGWLATGCFNTASSDIDLLVVTDRTGTVGRLKRCRPRTYAPHEATVIEIAS
jgi:streptomycin 3"-adenylyltransferase